MIELAGGILTLWAGVESIRYVRAKRRSVDVETERAKVALKRETSEFERLRLEPLEPPTTLLPGPRPGAELPRSS